MRILGIETSCDETAAAVVVDGTRILSSVVASQIDVHHRYGGVVPELASRKHIEAIVPVVTEALDKADVGLGQLDGLAVTQGPGLIGSLLVGFSYAKALAYALALPWIGVNHLQGHIHSVFLQPSPPPFPFISLLVSGGHTNLYYVTDYLEMDLLGQTRDDAAGEAFDKVAKMLALGYPGGVAIDELARAGDPAKIEFPRAFLDKSGFEFSFSGIKTAVNRYIQTHPEKYKAQLADIVAGFQEAVVDVLTFKAVHACLQKGCQHLALGGGVAANSRLRERIRMDAAREGLTVHLPPLALCGDNAAMIAAAGYHYLKAGRVSDMQADVYSRVK
ncbi:MAG: tRNA (adenosine(37)-N6)-threonylcarbamoyltransferase complex transferase subunit TsaD [Desulfobacterales bacterium]|nr:tRNA (adenosine(37)-N6)-threonylcarbamoyltransferase complex transferase subunit TsaD [Desulfobacterales bacterium]